MTDQTTNEPAVEQPVERADSKRTYAENIVNVSASMYAILENEMARMSKLMGEAQTSEENANMYEEVLTTFANFVIARNVVAELNNAARLSLEKLNRQSLVLAQSPGLVDSNGNPINRQAAREMKRRAG